MKLSRFNEEQIIGILIEHSASLGAADLCHRYAISDAPFSKLRWKYGGIEVLLAERLKSLEDENVELKSCWRRACWTWRH